MNRWLKALLLVLAFVLVVLAFVLAIYLTFYVARLPESNCTINPLFSSWSQDRTYKATLLRKDCNSGETIFFSVRVDKVTPSRINGIPMGGWFLVEDIEEDPYPDQAVQPELKWISHQLLVDIPAEKFTGTYRRQEGELVIVRSYIPKAKNSN